MGPNVLWLTEWISQGMKFKENTNVLDLGCGKALSSVFLSQEFKLKVWATDLWIKPTENFDMINQLGLTDNIYPIYGDARELPFAHKYFDNIVCIDSYIYFGTDDLYLNYILDYVKPGGKIGIVVPGLMKEFTNGVPRHLEKFWGQDCWSWHTVDWWKELWERTGLVDIEIADTLKNGCQLYLQWKEAQEEVGKNPWPDDLEVLKEDKGEYIGFIRLIAKKKH